MKAYDLICLEMSFGIFRAPELIYQRGVRADPPPHMGQYLEKPIWNRVKTTLLTRLQDMQPSNVQILLILGNMNSRYSDFPGHNNCIT